MNYKEITRKTYDRSIDIYEKKVLQNYQKVEKLVNIFLKHLTGKKILDLGAGTGNYGKAMKEKGYDVICIDNSEEMVKKCRQKGLIAKVMDIEELDFPENTFDGVCASASLIHIPKANLEKVLKSIKRVLKPGGLFYVGVQTGDGEKFIDGVKLVRGKRFIVYYQEEELKEKLLKYFGIIKIKDSNGWINALCKN
ncbi:MAG: class I SAM-dependent methyltransferase [Candidatus Woesearchaeota archaeon]|nr:MAG: class I SAM-dependent methyltransferase [Candidatus Woesearchaeota archaeon]